MQSKYTIRFNMNEKRWEFRCDGEPIEVNRNQVEEILNIIEDHHESVVEQMLDEYVSSLQPIK